MKNISITSVLIPLTIFLHALWGTLWWYHFILYRDGVPDCEGKTTDSIWYAQQVGRLDLISLLLASFGIILAIIAIGWFNYIRTEAKQEARDEIRDCGEEIISRHLEKNPAIVMDAIQGYLAMREKVDYLATETSEEDANEIARSIGSSSEQ